MKERKVHRPDVTYSDEIAKEICETIAVTPIGLIKLCDMNQHWPTYRAIYKWNLSRPEFAKMFRQAKKDQADTFVDQCIDIADDSGFDATINAEGKAVCKNDSINRARLRVDTRRWVASKLKPIKYGEKSISDNKHKVSVEDLTRKVREAKDEYKY